MSKRIIVACGSGVATSQAVASKLGRLLKERGVDADIEAVDIKRLQHEIPGSLAYVSIVKDDTDWGIPRFNGVAFLTGMGQDAELQKIIDLLESSK